MCSMCVFVSFFCRIRGTLCSILVLAASIGTLFGFAAGHYLDYAETPRFALMFPILFIAFFSFMPETPYYFMKINRIEVCTVFKNISFKYTFMKKKKQFKLKLGVVGNQRIQIDKKNMDKNEQNCVRVVN